MTHDVIIALGSSHLQAVHIQWASERLASCLQHLRLSRRLWTEDIRGTGIFYMNRLVAASTTLSATALEQQLKAIEAETRRTSDSVTLDLDLMQYDSQRFHEKDWPRPYIQQLLPDIQ